MSSVSSVSGVTRYWGLASGLDVESIVEGLTSDIQSQIDTAKADQQKLEWKQTAYRDVISTLNEFETAFTQTGEDTSMMSADMYTSYSVSSSNNLLTATASAAASGVQQNVVIRQSALTAYVTGSAISKNRVLGTVDLTSDFDSIKALLTDKTYTLKVDDTSKSLSFTEDELNSASNDDDFVSLLNDKLLDSFGRVDGQAKVTASLDSGMLSFVGSNGTVYLTTDVNSIKESLEDKSITMTVDDLSKSITFTQNELNSISNADDFVSFLNDKLVDSFGTIDGQARVTASLDSGKLSFIGASGYESTQIAFDGSYAATALGVNQLDNRTNLYENLGAYLAEKNVIVSSDSSISATEDAHYNFDVTLNGKTVTLNTKTMTVKEALNALNSAGTGVKATYNRVDDKLTLSSTQSGSTGSVTMGTDDNTTALFKSLGIDMSDSSSYTSQQGRDAIVSINGTNYVRASNNFTIDGVSYAINGDVEPTDSSVSAQLTFNSDTTKLEAGIKKFISAYNSVVQKLTKYINTKPDPDDSYEPLTDAQKEDMTTEQIDKWNDKADDTILYNDSNLSGILDSMRAALYQSVTLSDGSTFALYDMGITTSDDYSKNGEIEIKADDLAKFKDALATQTDKIAEFFTKQSDILLQTKIDNQEEQDQQNKRYNDEGIISRLDDIIKKQTGDVFGNFGTLLQIAGSDTYCTTTNFLYQEIKDTKDKITSIQTRMTDKQNALYEEFQTLESYMSTANAQSSMLTNMLGSN